MYVKRQKIEERYKRKNMHTYTHINNKMIIISSLLTFTKLGSGLILLTFFLFSSLVMGVGMGE